MIRVKAVWLEDKWLQNLLRENNGISMQVSCEFDAIVKITQWYEAWKSIFYEDELIGIEKKMHIHFSISLR